MTSRSSSPDTGLSCSVILFACAGILLMLSGGIMAYPLLQQILYPPVTFGEARPLLRPTVTPLPNANQVTQIPTPALLPETPLLLPGQPEIPATPVVSPATPLWAPSSPTPTVLAPPRFNEKGEVYLPTRLVIPAIQLDAPIESVGWSHENGVSTWNIPNHFAAGWLDTSAPFGLAGNTVLDGHHNMAGEVFRRLVDLEAGDLIELYADDQVRRYEVAALHILPDRDEPLAVRRENATWIQPTLDERLTLVTCWPYTNNTHRLIIVAHPYALNRVLDDVP